MHDKPGYDPFKGLGGGWQTGRSRDQPNQLVPVYIQAYQIHRYDTSLSDRLQQANHTSRGKAVRSVWPQVTVKISVWLLECVSEDEEDQTSDDLGDDLHLSRVSRSVAGDV